MKDIPLCKPELNESEIKEVRKVLESGWVAHGPKNEKLEKKFSNYLGVKHAISLNSCTSALQLAIEASELEGEIIVPSFTFMASANAIMNAGCQPRFVDIKYDTCNIDPSKIEDAITDKTEGIMPVHFAGQSCDMDEIMKIADEYNLTVIEDSAEAIGAEHKGKKTGTFGIGCFSFWATKNMTTGEGGMLVTNDDNIAEKVERLKGHGNPGTTWEREGIEMPWKRDCVIPGYNYRMSNILAAIGIVQLSKLEDMNNRRREIASHYNNLDQVDCITTPLEKNDCYHVYQMYTIKVNDIDRDKLVSNLKDKGVGASVHFDPPVHQCTHYRENFKDTNLPITEKVSNSIVTLPLYPSLNREEVDWVINQVKKEIRRLLN